MRKIMFTAAGVALLVAPAITRAAPIAGPLPVANVSGEIVAISHLSEAHRGRHLSTRHISTRHVRVYPGPRSSPGIDTYASYPSGSRPVPRLVAPGDPGNPDLTSDFDRAVQENQYNGR
jgi:hypothetical protein